MRNPPRKARIFAALVASGAALAWLGVQRHNALGQEWVSGVMIAGGFTLGLITFVFLVQALLHTRGMAKLEAGIGRLAQWRVSPADWDKFRAADDARAVSDVTFLGNDLWIRKATPPEGVEVVVGEKSLIVDGSYHVLRMNGIPELR
jgi:hypothetical protein